jgi:hypothetical protein
MLNLVYFIPTYFIFLIIRTLFILVGWILIPPLALFHTHTTKKEISVINGREILNFKYKFMFPWNNNEDGIAGASEFKDKPMWFRIVYWSALRNPANNLRFVKYITCKIEPSKVKFILSKAQDINGNVIANPTLRDYDRDDLRYTTLIWQGIYSNLRIQFKMNGKIWRAWIGFKIYAHDSLGISPADYRYHGAGFATQFKRVYPRENK